MKEIKYIKGESLYKKDDIDILFRSLSLDYKGNPVSPISGVKISHRKDGGVTIRAVDLDLEPINGGFIIPEESINDFIKGLTDNE